VQELSKAKEKKADSQRHRSVEDIAFDFTLLMHSPASSLAIAAFENLWEEANNAAAHIQIYCSRTVPILLKLLVSNGESQMKPLEKDKNRDATANTAQTSFKIYAEPLIAEAIEQAMALNGSPDAEVLHKLRVALRQLSSLLWAYQPILEKDFGVEQRAVCRFLAQAARNTRDWDILISLLEKLDHADMAAQLRDQREQAFDVSRETLSNANITKLLRDDLAEANRELSTSGQKTPLRRSASKNVSAAQRQLHKRIKHASHATRGDYESLHAVRKAGKKVRYLLEFFENILDKNKRKGIKKLKRLQERFGALNNVAESRQLLLRSPNADVTKKSFKRAMRTLGKEQERRRAGAEKLL